MLVKSRATSTSSSDIPIGPMFYNFKSTCTLCPFYYFKQTSSHFKTIFLLSFIFTGMFWNPIHTLGPWIPGRITCIQKPNGDVLEQLKGRTKGLE